MVLFYCHRTEEDSLYFKREVLFSLTEEVWAKKDQAAFISSHDYLYFEFGFEVV